MPRPVRDSDDDTEAKPARRTRLLPDNSITNSPVRRSSRLKQPTRQNAVSPDSPSHDTSIRTTRRRAGTLDSTGADSHRSLRSRKISDASDISELADMDSSTTQKRSTRRSLTAVSSVDAAKPTTRLTRQFVRAGSETKSPAPTRTMRRTRASSVDPESINPKHTEETDTPTKVLRSRGRASILHLEPSVKEEGEDNGSFTSTDVDTMDDHASESGSCNVSPNLSISTRTEQVRSAKSLKNTSSNKLSMEKIDEQDSSGNSTSDGSKISVDTDSGQVAELTPKAESQKIIQTASDKQMELTPNSPMKPSHNVSSHALETNESKNETLGSKNVDSQQSSPSDKENKDINVHNRSLEKQKTDLVTKLAIVKDDIMRNVTLQNEYNKKSAFEVDSDISLSVSVNTVVEKDPTNSNGSITSIKTTSVQKENDYMLETKKSPVKKRLLYWEADRTLSLDEEPDKVTTVPKINVTNEEGDTIIESSVLSSKDELGAANSKEIINSTEIETTTNDSEQKLLSTDDSKTVDSKVDELKSVDSSQVKENSISESTTIEINREASYADEKMDIDESIVEDKQTENTVKDTSLTLEAEELETSLLLKIDNDSCVLNTFNKNATDATANENKVEDKEYVDQTEDDLKLYVSDDTRNTIEFSTDVQQANADASSENQDDVNNDTFTKFATGTMEIETSVKETSVEKTSAKTDENEESEQLPVEDNNDDIPEPMETSDLPEDKTINTSVKPSTESVTEPATEPAVEDNTENILHDKLNKSTDSLPRDSITSMTDMKLLTKENDNDLLDTVENIEPSIVTETQTPQEVTEDLPPEKEKEETNEKEVSKRLSTGDLKMSRKYSIAGDEETSNHEGSSEVDKNERPTSNADLSDSDMNIGSLFKDIPAEEWNTQMKAENRPSSVNSANTEKAENDSENECDLVLVDKSAWQAAEKIKEMKSSQDLEYDSDDTVELKALADSMHEPAEQDNDDEVDNVSMASQLSAEKVAVDDQVESNDNESVQDTNTSRRKSLDSKKLNSSRRKSLNETLKKSEDTGTAELNSSKKRKSLLDSGKKNASVRNVSLVETIAEKVNSPLSRKDSVERRKSLNSSLIQSGVSHVAKKAMMEATSTPFKDKATLGMSSFGNITLFKKQGESSLQDTSLKNSKLKSGLIDDDESGSDIVNVSGKKKKRNQCVSSDDEEEEEEEVEEEGEEEAEEDLQEEIEEEEGNINKSSDHKKKKLESSVKDTSKKNTNVNYSKVVEIDSSESNSEPESDNSDWKNESRKIPRFLFAQAGDTSGDDSEEESEQKSIDSDIEREYNLGGKSNLEYSDDNVPGDICRPSETESSDSEDDGADLKDFIVDDDEVEDESEEEEKSESEKAADEEGEEDEEAENEAVEETEEAENEVAEEAEDEIVEEAEDEIVEEADNEVVEEVEMAEIKETETKETEKVESSDEDEEPENDEIEKAENQQLNEAEIEKATDEKVEKDNQKDENKVKMPYIVEENVETEIVPSENAGTIKFNVIDVSSPRPPKLTAEPTNNWLVDEDVKVVTDKTSREAVSSPFDLMKKKRKRSGLDATPELRSRKMKRMENTQEILMDEEEIDVERESIRAQRVGRRKLLISEDVENEPVNADKIQKKTKKVKEISEVPSVKVSKTKKMAVDLAKVEKTSKMQHQLADVETNLVPKIARSKQQTAEHVETVKSKKRKVQLEEAEEDVAPEANVNKKQRKKANKDVPKLVNSGVLKKPQLEILSDSDEAPDTVAFAKAKEEALRAIKETTENIKLHKELLKKKQMDHLERMRQEREQKERKANRMELVRADKTEKTLKRLPSEVLDNLSDAPRPRKKQKSSKKMTVNDVLPSRSMLAPNVKVDENFITLSSASGSTTQFNIVNLQKAEKRTKKTAGITSFRQKMLARNSRQPVSTYLAYLRKQKAAGKDKQRGKPF